MKTRPPQLMLRAFLLTLSLLAWVPAVQASAIAQLQAFATQTRSARGAFVQKVTSRTQRASPVTSGEFSFARPGKFRWVYLKPYEQLIVADGETLTIFDKDLNQASVKKLDDALGATPAAILFGSNDLEQRFVLKEAGNREGVDWLDATPKSRDTAFERISIGFRNGALAAMELRDALGQTTLLTFSKLEINATLASDVFRFVIPKGADVLRN